MPACRNPHAATCCQEFHATDATKILRNERHGSLRCERCAFVAGAARNNSAPHEKVSRYERHENITLRVLTLRALRFRCGRCVKKIKKFTPRTLREIHAKNTTSTYVADVAFSLRTLRERY